MWTQHGNTILFFATSKEPIELTGKYNIRDKKKIAMMPSRCAGIPSILDIK